MQRRDFIKLCSSTAVLAATGTVSIPNGYAVEGMQAARLVDVEGNPVKVASLNTDENYIFHYPYQSTPCLLLSLGKQLKQETVLESDDGTVYTWPGGAGPESNIVAYSAICPHALSYNSRAASILNYNTAKSQIAGIGESITCCAHASVYDPADGARVLSGLAPKPLATILLEYDAGSDELTAVGVIGSDVFTQFLKTYKKDLREEYGRGGAEEFVTEKTVLMPAAEYSAIMIQC